MLARIPPALRALPLAALALGLAATPGAGQFQDARLPESGRLWFELTPELFDWSEQFAAGSGELPDGSREPLFAHFDGPLAARLFPGPEVFIDDLNADAAALGYDPVTAADFSLGDLDFSSVRAQVRRLGVGFELGVLDRLSVGFRAPFTRTDVEASSIFDSTTASVTGAAAALPPGSAFFTEAQSSLAALQGLIDGGTLSGMALADAIRLRADADAFLMALERRGTEGGLIPTGPSVAGAQMAERFGEFVAGFEALGLTLPALALPQTGTRADFESLFRDELVAFRPRNVQNALDLGEVEVSVRFGLIDQITPRGPPATADSARARADSARARGDSARADTTRAVVDSVREAGPGAADRAAAGEAEDDGPGGIRLRTSIGVLARIPIRSASFPPFANAAHFLDVPIGDGQTDIELALYQDIAFAGWLVIRASARYGIQRPDDLILRVAPPDRPYASEALQTVVRRDLGDYALVLVRPSVRLNSALSIGLEYEYFRLGSPSYALAEALPGVPDASPLELEAAQTRHRVGVGFLFDLTEARGKRELNSGEPVARAPLQFGVSLRRAVSGSGGQTPASFRFGADFRVPIGIF